MRGIKRIKIIYFVLLFVLNYTFANCVFAEQLPEISVNNTEGASGDSVDMIVEIKNIPEISGIQMIVEYNKKKLQLVEVNDLGLLSDSFMNPDLSSYPYILSWGDGISKCNKDKSGKIVKLQFEILEPFQMGTEKVSVTISDALDMDLNDVNFANTSVFGEITLVSEKNKVNLNNIDGEDDREKIRKENTIPNRNNEIEYVEIFEDTEYEAEKQTSNSANTGDENNVEVWLIVMTGTLVLLKKCRCIDKRVSYK